MDEQNKKAKATGYWVVTILLCIGMVAGGLAQLVRFKVNVDGIIGLGYPVYILSIIGVWKLLGAVALLIPGFLLVKEWAYAGFFFLLTGAVISHITSGDTLQAWIAPFIFSLLTVASWYLRPPHRRLIE